MSYVLCAHMDGLEIPSAAAAAAVGNVFESRSVRLTCAVVASALCRAFVHEDFGTL